MSLLKPKPKPKNQGAKLWLAFRRSWIKRHPPDHAGYYRCELCRQPVFHKEMQLDHILKRGSHPELRLVESNVRPTCAPCNLGRI